MTHLDLGDFDPDHVASFLKVLSNRDRLQILCHLVSGEQSVGTIEKRLQLRQPALSQQLARLRADRLVKTRREGKIVFYALADDRVARAIRVLKEMCAILVDLRGDSAFVQPKRAAAEPS